MIDLSLISVLIITHYNYNLLILLSIQNMHDSHIDVLHLSLTKGHRFTYLGTGNFRMMSVKISDPHANFQSSFCIVLFFYIFILFDLESFS